MDWLATVVAPLNAVAFTLWGAGLTTRIVVVGAESTGTTTVAALLAQHYAALGGSWADTQCVPEYGREYTRIKWDRDPDVPITDLVWTQKISTSLVRNRRAGKMPRPA